MRITRPSRPTSIGSSRAIHRLSAPATADSHCPANSTLTVVPGSAQPHTGTARPRCNTMLSVNIFAVGMIAFPFRALVHAVPAKSKNIRARAQPEIVSA